MATAAARASRHMGSRSCLRRGGSAAAHGILHSGRLAVIEGPATGAVASQVAAHHRALRSRASLVGAAGTGTVAVAVEGAGTRQTPAPASAVEETSGMTSWQLS